MPLAPVPACELAARVSSMTCAGYTPSYATPGKALHRARSRASGHHAHRDLRRRPGYRRHRDRLCRRRRPVSPAGTTSPHITAPRRSRCHQGTGRFTGLSRRGNRRLNHAVHMAAVTQIRHRHSDGRAYYDRKLAEGKTPKEALRSLKRRISDAIYSHLQADARRAAPAARTRGPGGQPGNDSVASAAGHTPETGSSAKPLPSPPPPYDALTDTHEPVQHRRRRKPGRLLTTKRHRSGRCCIQSRTDPRPCRGG